MSQHDSPFHDDEIAVQARLGIADKVAKYGNGFIRSMMPEQHREFFCQLPMIVIGIVDKNGYPWSIPLYGIVGFIESPDDQQLTINALPNLVSGLGLKFNVGQKIGMLGIELETRRRNRMNGVIGTISTPNTPSIDTGSFTINVDQSFGNCPQYIQKRIFNYDSLNQTEDPKKSEELDSLTLENKLSHEAKTLIESTDTFFIASRTSEFSDDPRTGIDASHRGGKPGFVKVVGNNLYFPDFSGNKFFNTIGNIVSDGRVGLYFPDYSTGDVTLLIGHAKVDWDSKANARVEGAERIVAVDIEKSVFIPKYLPAKGELIEHSPALNNTGVWR